MNINWVSVTSRFARRIALAGTRPPYLLIIHTVRGDYLPYRGVTPGTFVRFANAPSKGRFYLANIKGQYLRADMPSPAGDEGDDRAYFAAAALWSQIRNRPVI